MKHSLWGLVWLMVAPAAWPQGTTGGPVYRCPGPPILYTDQISAQEAKEKNCRTIEGAPITIMSSIVARAPHAAHASRNRTQARTAEACAGDACVASTIGPEPLQRSSAR